jgi:hypothetical protein
MYVCDGLFKVGGVASIAGRCRYDVQRDTTVQIGMVVVPAYMLELSG